MFDALAKVYKKASQSTHGDCHNIYGGYLIHESISTVPIAIEHCPSVIGCTASIDYSDENIDYGDTFESLSHRVTANLVIMSFKEEKYISISEHQLAEY